MEDYRTASVSERVLVTTGSLFAELRPARYRSRFCKEHPLAVLYWRAPVPPLRSLCLRG
jgi:hypothetical protein